MAMDASLDFMSSALEEIALEGLDGITVSSLWVRLENRPKFSISLDERSKSFIWECLAVHKDIEVYQMSKPRPVLQIHDRYQFLDPEFGMVTEPQVKPEDIYSLHVVEDGLMRGSCASYKTRKCVTSVVRHGTVLLLPLNQVVQKWGERAVLVASPKMRLLALLGTEVNPLLELSKEQYCLLERIGRSRYHGEVSQGESGLLSLKCASIKDHLHYHATKLIKKGLITKQKHILKTKSTKTITGSLFHLTRFYVRRKVKFDTLLEFMYNILKDKPKNREESKKLQMEMGIPMTSFRKFLKRIAYKWFRLSIVPHREMYPDDPPESFVQKNGHDKQVKVIQMIRPYVEEEVEEDEDSHVDPYFDPSKVDLDRPLLCQVHHVVHSAGPNGATLSDVRKVLTLPRLDVRSLLRILVKKKAVISIMQDRGRQRFEKFISKEFEFQSTTCINMKKQADQFTQQNIYDVPGEDVLEDTALSKVGDAPDLQQDERKPSKYENREANEFQNIESKVIELDESETIATPRGTLLRTQSLAAVIKSGSIQKDKKVSERLLKRANMMFAFIKRAKVTTITELNKMVRAEEKKEGYNYEIDKRSIQRLVSRLCTDHRAKILKTILKLDKVTKEIQFVCHPSIEANSVELKTAIEQAKFQHFSVNKSHNSNEVKSTEKEDIKPVIEATDQPPLSDKENVNRKQLSPLLARQVYGLQPKFTRTKALHLFLSYLVNHYEGPDIEEKEKSFVYHQSDSWKRFVPPLPKYKHKGWCILSDAISRMPLSIFVKIINLRYEIPHLEDMLKNVEKQQYLLKHLPQDLRNDLLGNRKYLFMIHDILCRLCHMGLVSFGPRIHFQKDQVYLYIHRNTQIKDTSICPPGYIQIDESLSYDVRKYHFQTFSDVENYWIDLETTCLHTILGKYGTAAGQKIMIFDPNQKPELSVVLKNEEMANIIDTGKPPGDGLGAAGLDSSLFAHLRRNWMWPNINYKVPIPQQKTNSVQQSSGTLRHLLEMGSKKINHPESRVRLQRLTKRLLTPSKKRAHSSSDLKESPAKKIMRIKKPIKKVRMVKVRKLMRPRRPFYDEKDRSAIASMSKMRVDWTPQEDSLLLMCKVASMFLDENYKSLVVPCTVIRDVLNEKLPKLTYNKTSRACQRRLRHMLVNNAETRNSVGVFLGEAKQDIELVKEFSMDKPPKTREDNWREMFITVLEKLLNKFTSVTENHDAEILPRTIVELHSDYNIVHPVNVMDSYCDYPEPESDIDIYHAVIASIILSSLSSVKDTFSWTYVLYKIYEQYPDEMLRKVLGQFNKKRLITKKLAYQRSNSLNDRIHCSTIPYRFSVTYENCFLTKYPERLYIETKELLTRIEAGSVELQGDPPAGYISTILPLILLNKLSLFAEVPEQIIIFKFSLTDKQRSTMEEEMLQSPITNELPQSAETSIVPNTISNDEELEQSVDHKTKRQKLDVAEGQLKNSDVCTITVTNPESEDSNVELRNVSSASRLAFYMLQEQLDHQKKGSYSQDEISVNPCCLKCEMKPETEHWPLEKSSMIPAQVIDPSSQSDSCVIAKDLPSFEKIVSTHTHYIPQELMDNVNDKEVLEEAYGKYASDPVILLEGRTIYDEICSSTFLGIELKNLWKKFSKCKNVSLLDHLSILTDARLVLQVGISSFRYVAIMHSRMWLLSSVASRTSGDKDDASNISKTSTVTSDVHSDSSEQLTTLAGDGISDSSEQLTTPAGDKISDSSEQLTTSAGNKISDSNEQLTTPGDKISDSNEQLTTPGDRISRSHSRKRMKTSNKTNDQNPVDHGVGSSMSISPTGSVWEPVLFMPRVWRKPDGSLNSPVFIRLLRSILSYIMSTPGATEKKICERFSSPLQPVFTLELLDVLEQIQSIYKYYQKAPTRASLFSPCVTTLISWSAEPTHTVYYESCADAIIKITKFSDYVSSLNDCTV